MGCLVDTSLWVDHFRRKGGDPELGDLLKSSQSVFLHDFVYGELLLGGVDRSIELKDLLQYLPRATLAVQAEVEELIAARNLTGSGIGWVDAHLIASALLDGLELMTKDQKLLSVWQRIMRK